MATIAELMVKISTQDTNFKRGLANASNRAGKFVKSVAKKLAVIGAIVAAAVAVGLKKVLDMISRVSDEMDRLAKTTDKLGIGAESFQALEFAAKLAGVSVSELDTSITRMLRNVSEAAKGIGTATDALEDLGISANQLNALSPEQQFMEIGRALQFVSNQGDKMRIVMDIFGRSGASLLNIFNGSLDDSLNKFKELGLGVSREQLRMAEAFNDSKTVLGAVWDDFTMRITAGVAPALQSIVERITQITQDMGGMDVVAKKVTVGILKGVMSIVQAFEFLHKTLQGIIVLFNAVNVAFEKLKTIQAADFLPGPLKAAGQLLGVQAAPKDRTGVIQAEDKLGRSVDALADNTSTVSSVLQDVINSLQQQQTAVQQAMPGTSGAGPQAGFGVITDVATGRTLGTGNVPQPVDVRVSADKDGIISAVVTNPQFQNSVTQQVNSATKDAARATRR